MRWERLFAGFALLVLAVLPLVPVAHAETAGKDALHLSAVQVSERDSVLEIGFDLSDQADYELAFSEGAVRLSMTPVVMDTPRQVYDVNHPLLSRVVARQVGLEQVTVWLLTNDFNARQLEGAVRVVPGGSGLRLQVGQELLPAAGSLVGPASDTARAESANSLWEVLRASLPNRAAFGIMAAMLMASLLGGVILLRLNRRRARSPLVIRSQVKVGPGRRILVVETDGRRLLVSMEPAGMRLIADLECDTELQPVQPEAIPVELLNTPHFAFAEKDVRLLRGRKEGRREDNVNLEIAS